MEFRKKIFYQDWKMTIQPDGQLEVTKAGETRIYNIPEKIKDVVEENEYVHINVEGGLTYQFKFEVENFLVGDIYRTSTGEMIDTFACHVFGE